MRLIYYIHKFFDYLFSFRTSKKLLFLKNHGFLKDSGWVRSIKQNKLTDIDGQPVPWLNYSLIDFLRQYLKKDMILFEYGSGSSSLFFSTLVKHVYTIEHDKNWLSRYNFSLASNITVYHETLEEEEKYIQSIHRPNKHFDVIIIDGRSRVNCMKEASTKLNLNGIIILDDCRRPYYEPGINYLTDIGFKKIEFSGMVPNSLNTGHAYIFYRNHLA